MKRITFADVPELAIDSEIFPDFIWAARTYSVVDVWRDPRTGIAITVVVDGPTGRTWLGNPGCDATGWPGRWTRENGEWKR